MAMGDRNEVINCFILRYGLGERGWTGGMNGMDEDWIA